MGSGGLILPANGNEYVLKGSTLVEESNSGAYVFINFHIFELEILNSLWGFIYVLIISKRIKFNKYSWWQVQRHRFFLNTSRNVENALCESLILGSENLYCPFKDCSALLVDNGGQSVTLFCTVGWQWGTIRDISFVLNVWLCDIQRSGVMSFKAWKRTKESRLILCWWILPRIRNGRGAWNATFM